MRGRVLRAVGVELESEMAYSALQQLCAPLMGHVDRLPGPGLRCWRPPDGRASWTRPRP